MVVAEERKNREKEKQFKKSKGKYTKLKCDLRGGRLRSYCYLLMEREGKKNRSIVKHYCLYQTHCEVLKYYNHKCSTNT